MRKVSVMILLSLLVLAVQGYAQTITGSMSGRIVDQQGSAVPNATITAKEPSRNTTNTVKTNDQGDFLIAGLQPGVYNVAVEAAGFKRLERKNSTLDAASKLSMGDMTLQVGAITESIEVSATAATLQTESVERSATITGKQVENIQVNGRNPIDMALVTFYRRRSSMG